MKRRSDGRAKKDGHGAWMLHLAAAVFAFAGVMMWVLRPATLSQGALGEQGEMPVTLHDRSGSVAVGFGVLFVVIAIYLFLVARRVREP